MTNYTLNPFALLFGNTPTEKLTKQLVKVAQQISKEELRLIDLQHTRMSLLAQLSHLDTTV